MGDESIPALSALNAGMLCKKACLILSLLLKRDINTMKQKEVKKLYKVIWLMGMKLEAR